MKPTDQDVSSILTQTTKSIDIKTEQMEFVSFKGSNDWCCVTYGSWHEDTCFLNVGGYCSIWTVKRKIRQRGVQETPTSL